MKELDELVTAAQRTVDAADDVLASPLSSVALNALSQARASLFAALRDHARADVSARPGRVFFSSDFSALEMKLHAQIRTAFEEAEAQRRATTRRPNMRQAAKDPAETGVEFVVR